MNALRKIGKFIWNKYTKALLLAAVLIAVILVIWDRLDISHSRGSADPQAMAREEKLWQTYFGLLLDNDKYKSDYLSIKQKYSQAAEQKPAAGSDQLQAVRKQEDAELQKFTADHAEKLRNFKRHLLQLDVDADADYRDDALMLHALCSDNFYQQLLGSEMRFNAERHFGGPVNSLEKYGEFYKLYSQENGDKSFKYPDLDWKFKEEQMLGLAIGSNANRCFSRHCGYGFWQGRSREQMLGDVNSWLNTGYAAEMNDLAKQDAADDIMCKARLNCLELRRRHGSKFAALWMPVKFFFSETLGDQFTLSVMQIAHGRRNKKLPHNDYSDVNFLALGPMNKTALTQEDRLWRVTQYAALNTGNYLWTVKFINKDRVGDGKLFMRQIRPQYTKNSKEMQAYSDSLSADLQDCRRKIQADGFQNLSELRRASSELCDAAEDIIKVWNLYRNDKIDYETFVASLQKAEAGFEKKRRAVLSLRWDYLTKRCRGVNFYIIWSMQCDGVSMNALAELIDDKITKQQR